MVEDRVIAEHLKALFTPIIASQSWLFRELGLRELNLFIKRWAGLLSYDKTL